MSRLSFCLFVIFLVAQTIASFNEFVSFQTPFQGIRVFESSGRYICRAGFEKMADEGFSPFLLKDELQAATTRNDFKRLKIYHPDYARERAAEVCGQHKELREIRIRIQCRTDWGWGDPHVEVLKCHS